MKIVIVFVVIVSTNVIFVLSNINDMSPNELSELKYIKHCHSLSISEWSEIKYRFDFTEKTILI